jgi:hypothetical protein
MVPAAALSFDAQTAIERYLWHGRQKLHRLVGEYLRWLHGPHAARVPPEEVQRRFVFLRLQFNVVLTQFDIFAHAITQRSEHQTGVWLSGLDAVAADALSLPGGYYQTPPVICYLDRDHGAAIRRAHTRLPGGGRNPVAIIRIPRERMIGTGIASSLVHEVGHQGAALLDLVANIRPLVHGFQQGPAEQRLAWSCWERWISEIVADLWAVARVGIAAPHGMIGVVSLPRYFVFRPNLDDPHPSPFIRVKLSCALGRALYPDPQWDALARTWETLYPPRALDPSRRRLFAALETSMPSFVSLLVQHRPPALRGRSLQEALSVSQRSPARLRAYFKRWDADPRRVRDAPPSLALAVFGQARADGTLTPEAESRVVDELLTQWALRSTLSRSAICAAQSAADGVAREPWLAPVGQVS